MFPGPGPGRPKGIPNKAALEVRAAAKALIDDPDYRISLSKRLNAGVAPHMETLLWHYAYGKPVERIQVQDLTDYSGLSEQDLQARARALLVATQVASTSTRMDEATVTDDAAAVH